MVRTGINSLDKNVNIEAGDLVVIASRPGAGKSSFAISILCQAAIYDQKPVAIFNLEINRKKVAKKILGRVLSFTGDEITQWEWVNFKEELLPKLIEASIYIDDTYTLTLEELLEKARKLKQERNISLIIIDYIQLMLDYQNKSEEIAITLKKLAKELNISIILVSQLSREVDKREDKRPILSDFSLFNIVTKVADKIIFLYRDNYYDDKSKNDITEIIIAKNDKGGMNGALGTVHVDSLIENEVDKETIEEKEQSLDELLPDVLEFVVTTNQVSISYVQRKFRIGYTHTYFILEQLERLNIISKPAEDRTRKILLKKKDLDRVLEEVRLKIKEESMQNMTSEFEEKK